MKVIDLSHLLHPMMPIFPDSAQPEFQQIANLKEDGYIETKITISSHVGTHVDAPLHMIKDGKALNDYDIGSFIGNAAILDVTMNKTGFIEMKDLIIYEETLKHVDFLLINSGWSKFWGEEKYFSGYPVFTNEAAKWLTQFKLKGIGLDTISVDHLDSSLFPNHQIFLEQEILIIENLTNLSAVDCTFFTFCCLPIKYEVSEASPVRAIGIIK